MRCPRCDRDGAHLLVALNPGVVLECRACGEVWRGEEDPWLVKFRVLYELAVEGARFEGE